MRIVHVLNSADPENGGTLQAVRGMSAHQAALGHEVTVVSTGRGGSCPSGRRAPASSQGVRWKVFPVQWSAWKWSYPMQKAMPAMVKAADIVHLHTVWEFPIYCGHVLSLKFEKPYVISLHGMLDRWSLSQHALKKKIYLTFPAGRILKYAKAAHFTSDGEYLNSTLTDKDQKGFICPLGVDGISLSERHEGVFYERYPELKGRRLILFLGRLHYKKNPELLIECLNKISHSVKNLTLVMAGPAEQSYLQRLKKKVKKLHLTDRVIFTGLLDRPFVSVILRLADVLVLPSLQENFGLSITEAMAASCPVIVSPAVNLSDDVEKSSAGIVCEPTLAQLSQALTQILSDDALRQRMGRNGRELVNKKFQWPKLAGVTVQIYEDILNGRHSCPAWVRQ